MGAQRSSGWPMVSTSLGVLPEQIPEAYQESVRLGVPTQFDRAGRPILTDPAHRKRYARALGMRDNNGGYSDP